MLYFILVLHLSVKFINIVFYVSFASSCINMLLLLLSHFVIIYRVILIYSCCMSLVCVELV